MKFINHICLFSISIFISIFNTNAQTIITSSQTALALANSLAGSGVIVTNPTLNCPGNANGLFQTNGLTTNLGIDSGILLTSGSAANVSQPASFSSSINNGTGGYIPLSNLVNVNTFDACVLELDFQPIGDTIKFNYVFGSDEYPTFNCSSFFDVFGFFISGPGITGTQNLAVVPGTNIPVGINSVNSGQNIGPMCTNWGPGSPFTQYYTNNASGSSICYNGFTHVFTAQSPVTPCQTYHLVLAISDGTDHILDSGVFLQAGSLSSNTSTIAQNPPGSFKYYPPFIGENCFPVTIPVTRKNTLSTSNVPLAFVGTALLNTDYTASTDTLHYAVGDSVAYLTITPINDGIVEGVENFKIYLTFPFASCASTPYYDSISLKIIDPITFDLSPNDTAICEGNYVQVSNVFNDSIAQFTTWKWINFNEGISDTSKSAPSINPGPPGFYTYTLNAGFPNCPQVSESINIIVDPQPFVNIFNQDTFICPDSPYTLQLSAYLYPQGDPNMSYVWTPTNHIYPSTGSLSPLYIGDLNSEYIALTATTKYAGCSASDSFLLSYYNRSYFDKIPDTSVTYPNSVNLYANGAIAQAWNPGVYLNFPNISNPICTPDSTTMYYLKGWDNHQCLMYDSVLVVVNFNDPIIGIPNSFTPNNDGKNDLFYPINNRYQVLTMMNIYDRWGNLVYTLSDNSKGWDGTYKGREAEIGVYYYVILFQSESGKNYYYKGDISLFR